MKTFGELKSGETFYAVRSIVNWPIVVDSVETKIDNGTETVNIICKSGNDYVFDSIDTSLLANEDDDIIFYCTEKSEASSYIKKQERELELSTRVNIEVIKDSIYDYINNYFIDSLDKMEDSFGIENFEDSLPEELDYSEKNKRINEFLSVIQKEQIYNTVIQHWRRVFISYVTKWTESEEAGYSLFRYFDMSNSKMFHKEHNPEYKDHTFYELYISFKFELEYCSDRMSWDRLFRTHWLFKQMQDELIYDHKLEIIKH